ncbi:hypothetical protein ACNQGP_14950 [Flavobacterium sp. GT2N3]|uniref:hypothetical protein n=1 Tax=unclassified Flavobacterium TaxID=196869 RepID=UPI003AAF998B
MIKQDRISQGEGEILDLKLKSSLSIADNSIFPITGLGESAGEIEHLNRIKKSIGFILPGMPSDTGKYSFVITQKSTLAKFNTVLHNTIETVVTGVISPSKNIITYKLLHSNILSSAIHLLKYLVKVKEAVLNLYYFLSDLKIIAKTDAKKESRSQLV